MARYYKGFALPYMYESHTDAHYGQDEIERTTTEKWWMFTDQYEAFRASCEDGKNGYALARISPQRAGDVYDVTVTYGPDKTHGDKIGWWTSTKDGLVYNETERLDVGETATLAAANLAYKYGLQPNGMHCQPSLGDDRTTATSSWGPEEKDDAESDKQTGKEYLSGLETDGSVASFAVTPPLVLGALAYALTYNMEGMKILGLIKEVAAGSITQYPPEVKDASLKGVWHRGGQWQVGKSDIVTELKPNFPWGAYACAIEAMKDIPYASSTISVNCKQYHEDKEVELSDVLSKANDVGKYYNQIAIDQVGIAPPPIEDPQIKKFLLAEGGIKVYSVWRFEGIHFKTKGAPTKIRHTDNEGNTKAKTLYKFEYSYVYKSVMFAWAPGWDGKTPPVINGTHPSGGGAS